VNTIVFILRTKLDKIVNFDNTNVGLKTNQFPPIFYSVIIIPNFVRLCPASLKMKYADYHTDIIIIMCVHVAHIIN
jgi:hypothetical protein